MHAQATATTTHINGHSCLQRADTVEPGQLFMRAKSMNEVLAPLSYAGGKASDPAEQTWAIVINVSKHSQDFLPGQLVAMPSSEMVRTVHEAEPARYALEN